MTDKPLARARHGADSTGAVTDPTLWGLVFAAWLVAAVSTLGALFLGEVMGFAPCVLCWYQRIFMFPLVFVLAMGLFPLDAKVVRYAFPLAAAGWLIAAYHVLLVAGIIPESATPCTQGVPCGQVQVAWFGFVTIPLLSLLSFTVINLMLLALKFRNRP
ncbi:MAG: disulfide bond formation protein DsbB [Ramlibacter sp.]|jgi:disulfide bond formation protein DsbB|nr:disulfide bond formation protein DsbB [Ramlibacter sp.]